MKNTYEKSPEGEWADSTINPGNKIQLSNIQKVNGQ